MTTDPRAIDDFLRMAICLAVDNVATGRGGPFGAVIVSGDQVVGRGTNLVTATHDPTAHAEVVAIRHACQAKHHFALEGCEIYTSCEPCPLCLAAIYWARIERIFYAANCDDAAAAGFDDRVFYQELAKPAALRTVPMTQRIRSEAQGAFELWRNNPDRVAY
jgi:tRNA(Arg) A34 adenosine deaminase TadA